MAAERILMVCLGNICRSPMAEGILRYQAETRGVHLEIDSAGTANYHVGEGPDHRAVRCLKGHGIDISKLRARQFSSMDFQDFDIIFTMDQTNYTNVIALAKTEEEKNKVRMMLNEAWPGENRPVPDPWFGDMRDFESVHDMLTEACDRFLDGLKTSNR